MVSLIIVALSKPFNALFHFAIPTDKTYVELITKGNEEEGEARYDSTQTHQEIVNLWRLRDKNKNIILVTSLL